MAGTYKILVCEDEETLTDIYRDFFGSHGFEVVCAKDGEEGVLLAEMEKPDLVILDMRMPKLDGYGTLKRLRQKNLDLPVLIVTAYGYICQVIQMMNLGISGYVTKPINYDKLLEKVNEILGMRRAEAEARR